MFPQRWIEGYLAYLLRHRRPVSVAIGLVTVGFLLATTTLRFNTDFLDVYPRQHPYMRFFEQFRGMFGSANILTVILEVQAGSIYNPETLQKLERMTKFIIDSRGVVPYQVRSIAHPAVVTVNAVQGGIEARPVFWPQVPLTQEDADRVRLAVYSSPAIRGVYVAQDDSAAVIYASLWERDLDYADLTERIAELRRTEEDAGHRIQVTGLPWLYASVLLHARHLYWIFGLTAATLTFLLYAYFRTWTGIWVPIASAIMSTVWGLGLAALLGFAVDPLVLVIPIFLTARALSHSVQSMDRYHEEYERLGNREQAIVASYSHLFSPAMSSIVTDGLTLLVVALVPIPLVQKVAIFATFWIVSIFVSVVTLHPIVLSWIQPPERRVRSAAGGLRQATTIMLAAVIIAVWASVHGWIGGLAAFVVLSPFLAWYWLSYSERIYGLLIELTIAATKGSRRYAVVVGAVAAAVVLPIWGWKLEVGDMTPGQALLFEDHPYNVAYDKLNQKFLGATQLVVMADAGTPNGIKKEESLRAIAELGDHMSGVAGAAVTITLVDIVREISRLMHEGDPKWALVPTDGSERNVFLFSQAAVSGRGDLFLDKTGQYSAVVTLFREHDHDTIETAIEWAKQFRNDDGLKVQLAGGVFGVLAAVNEVVESSYWLALVAIFAVVAVCLWLTYGSLAAATVLLIPVVLSQLGAEALMVALSIDLNANSLPVAAAGAGVGVDYGIYHFSRMIEAMPRTASFDAAVDHATATTGKAILFTASTMVAATVFWWFSGIKFQAEMGVLLALLMVFNTAGALLVVPAFVKTFHGRFRVWN